jgi:uncharacterized cupredoxin-like copper-binding protein
MGTSRRQVLSLVAGIALMVTAFPAYSAETTVNVTLWDKGENAMDMLGEMRSKGMLLGMGMMHGRGKGKRMARMDRMGPMGIDVDQVEVPAGDVTFAVTNESGSMIHEMVVAKVTDENVMLPYNDAMDKVDEDAAGHLGEVAELDPGQKGELKITLEPGSYILYCNIPGHYVLGMWTIVDVK